MRERPAAGRSRQAGFTMIELLVSLTVAIIALAGTLAMFVSLARNNKITHEQGSAVAIGQQVIEELRGRSVTELAATYGDGALPVDDVALPVIEERGVAFTPRLSVTASAIDPELALMRVEVVWADRGGTDDDSRRAISLELLRARQEGL